MSRHFSHSSNENQNQNQPAAVVAPQTEQAESVLAAVPQIEEMPAIDAGEIVEEAEQLLREGAPHDFDVLVIGGGPGGYVAALRAAQLGAHVGLVEERELGGVCLNRGCIPTKTLLESVDVMRLMRRAAEYGIHLNGEFKPDLRAMNRRKAEVVAALRENVARLLAQHDVEIIQGQARFTAEHSVEVVSLSKAPRGITAVSIIIASGSLPMKLPVPGADLPGVVTSDELLQSEVVPADIVVVGAGAVGVEFAYLFHELGARATLLEAAEAVLPQEDRDIGAEMDRLLRGFGLQLLTGSKLQRIEQAGERLEVVYSRGGNEERVATGMVLMATGRKSNTESLNLDEAGIRHDKGRIIVDEKCETNVAGVYAIGDCIRDVGWAHLAAGEGTAVAEHITHHPVTVDLSHVPSCYYTHPEIASVGRTQQQAEAAGIATRVGTFHFRSNGKAAAAGDHDGFVKVVADDATSKLLGCQIIGPRATDLISEAVLALKTNQTIDEMVGAIHAHPTFSEALPEAALNARGKPRPHPAS